MQAKLQQWANVLTNDPLSTGALIDVMQGAVSTDETNNTKLIVSVLLQQGPHKTRGLVKPAGITLHCDSHNKLTLFLHDY